MNSAALRRQIDRASSDLESIKPKPIVHCALMGLPPGSASPEEKASYQAKFDRAQAAGVFIIRLVPLTKESKP